MTSCRAGAGTGTYAPVMTDAPGSADCAREIAAARDRLLAFAVTCTAEEWQSHALDEHGDPRPVGVVIDHVADAYEYLAGWISEIAGGVTPAVSPSLVDELNERHAAGASQVSQGEAAAHLRGSGDAIAALVASLTAAQLDAADGMGRRLAQIAARHADSHRAELEAAVRSSA